MRFHACSILQLAAVCFIIHSASFAANDNVAPDDPGVSIRELLPNGYVAIKLNSPIEGANLIFLQPLGLRNQWEFKYTHIAYQAIFLNRDGSEIRQLFTRRANEFPYYLSRIFIYRDPLNEEDPIQFILTGKLKELQDAHERQLTKSKEVTLTDSELKQILSGKCRDVFAGD